jgi:glycosyltransferase involved in cell wall biosynthesis
MKISVVVTAYNHEKYITQCMESVLCQKGDFQLEVIAGDDCSKDNTRSILQQFQQKYPEVVFLLPPGENLGVTKNLKRCLDACSGEYIAICEGTQIGEASEVLRITPRVFNVFLRFDDLF